MCRGWSWGNLGGDFRAKKQTGKKNVYLLIVAVHTVEMIMEELRKEKEDKEMKSRMSTNCLSMESIKN
jgi:hypothetical protein